MECLPVLFAGRLAGRFLPGWLLGTLGRPGTSLAGGRLGRPATGLALFAPALAGLGFAAGLPRLRTSSLLLSLGGFAARLTLPLLGPLAAPLPAFALALFLVTLAVCLLQAAQADLAHDVYKFRLHFFGFSGTDFHGFQFIGNDPLLVQ